MALIDSIVSYWKMEEVSGNIIDAHSSNTGIAAGNPTYGEIGIINNAIKGDGTGDYFDIGTLGNLGTKMNSGFSIGFWIKTTTTTVQATPFGSESALGTPRLGVFLNSQKTTAGETGTIMAFYFDNAGLGVMADFAYNIIYLGII